MKSSWQNKTLLSVLFVIFVPNAAKGQNANYNGKCINVKVMGWRIDEKLAPGEYEIVAREASEFCGNTAGSVCYPIAPIKAILFTNGDKFDSEGVIRDDLWIANTVKNPEHREITLTNGFKKKYQVFRESDACAKIGGQQLKVEREKEKIEEAKARIQEAKEHQREIAEEKKENAAHAEQEKKHKEAESLWKE